MKQYWNKTTEQWQDTPPPRPAKSGLHVIPDIEPYQAVTGDVIDGRRQHREFLRRNGYIEVGNERIERKRTPMPSAENAIREAMAKAGMY